MQSVTYRLQIQNMRPLMTTIWFQHTAARRRLEAATANTSLFFLFQHTAARRRLAGFGNS